MAKVILMSESGDWFLVPWEKREDFYEDELNEDADYAQYVGNPNKIKIIDYELE